MVPGIEARQFRSQFGVEEEADSSGIRINIGLTNHPWAVAMFFTG